MPPTHLTTPIRKFGGLRVTAASAEIEFTGSQHLGRRLVERSTPLNE